MPRPRPQFLSLVLLGCLVCGCDVRLRAQTSAPLTSDEERVLLHHSAEWLEVAAHLPDPATSTPEKLEVAADVLRARRFPEDALDFYGYAMARGGNVTTLLNKMGMVRMELHQYDLARQMFLRVVRANKKNAQGWNNLGATEFLNHQLRQAAQDYHKASSLDKKSAVYHSNLGLVYFELGDITGARQELARATALDPHIMDHRDSGGTSAHVVASNNYPQLCFEFARMAAAKGDAPQTRLWLARAVEGGFDILPPLREDAVLRPFAKDPEVQIILANAKQLRSRKVAARDSLPPLASGSN